MAKKPETLNPFTRSDAAAEGDVDDVDADGDAAQRQSLLARRGVTKTAAQTKADSPSKSRRVGAGRWRVGSLRRALPLALVFVLGLAVGAALYSHVDTGMTDIRDVLAAAQRAKRNTALLGVDGAASAVSRVASDAFQLRAMTFNLRYGTAKDGADSWRYRRAHAADMINRHAPVVVGTQEGVAFQLAELQALLARPYERFGDPREPHGEHVQIFYDASVVERLDGGTFWLSETPHAPGSKGWDGVCVRVATWCRFRQLATGQVFYHVNTHLDSQGAVARFEGAKVLWREMEKVLARDALPATTPLLLTGDFNTFRPSNAFQFLTKDAQGPQLQDAWLAAEYRIGNISCTFHEFLGPKYDTLVHADWPDPDMDPLNGIATNHIDFILVRPPLTTLVTEVITEAWSGRYPSDHYPVVTTLLFPSPAELPPPKAR